MDNQTEVAELTVEEARWKTEADKLGIPLVALKPDSDLPKHIKWIDKTYEALKVEGFAAQLRLEEFIRRLQKEQRRQEESDRPPSPEEQKTKSNWALYEDSDVSAWQGFVTATSSGNLPSTLPYEPFIITTDSRPRYELNGKFVLRQCFESFEKSLLQAASNAKAAPRAPAMSVLGAKGAGKSVFFRYFCYKYCTKNLVVYVPDAGMNEGAIFGKLMKGLIFGLQCVKEAPDHTEAKKKFLREVRGQPLYVSMGGVGRFWSLWGQWLIRYPQFCKTAVVVIDQLQREGTLFEDLRSYPIVCSGYILISSTGILHHHNVSSFYGKLLYFFPVSPDELASVDKEKKLGPLGEIMTMLGAISILEGQSVEQILINAARKHYTEVKGQKLLPMLLAVVQSEEAQEAIDGSIWEDVLDPNYMWVGEDKMVSVAAPQYRQELGRQLKEEKVEYKQLLVNLLLDQGIVDEVGNGALGIHLEALLDIIWQEEQQIAWKWRKNLKSKVKQSPRTEAISSIRADSGEAINDIQPLHFGGTVPSDEEKLEKINWNGNVYFKPTSTSYAGFDMFLLKGTKTMKRPEMYAIQVTVEDAAHHGVEAFDESYLASWNNLIKTKTGKDVKWTFYMLTPQANPPAVCPVSKFKDIPVYQVGFHDLTAGGTDMQVVNDFPKRLQATKEKAGKRRKRDQD